MCVAALDAWRVNFVKSCQFRGLLQFLQEEWSAWIEWRQTATLKDWCSCARWGSCWTLLSVHADCESTDCAVQTPSVSQLLVDVAHYDFGTKQDKQHRGTRAVVSVLQKRLKRIPWVSRVQRFRAGQRLLRNDVSRFCKKLIIKVFQGCGGFFVRSVEFVSCAPL